MQQQEKRKGGGVKRFSAFNPPPKPAPHVQYLANLIDQYFEFIETEKDKNRQAAELLAMNALWLSYLKKRKLFVKFDEHKDDFIHKVTYYLKDRVERANKLREGQEQIAQPEQGEDVLSTSIPGTVFTGF